MISRTRMLSVIGAVGALAGAKIYDTGDHAIGYIAALSGLLLVLIAPQDR